MNGFAKVLGLQNRRGILVLLEGGWLPAMEVESIGLKFSTQAPRS